MPRPSRLVAPAARPGADQQQTRAQRQPGRGLGHDGHGTGGVQVREVEPGSGRQCEAAEVDAAEVARDAAGGAQDVEGKALAELRAGDGAQRECAALKTDLAGGVKVVVVADAEAAEVEEEVSVASNT